MSSIYRLFSKGMSAFYTILKYFVWKRNLSTKHSIKILENEKFNFTHYGDIAEVLFAVEHLVDDKEGFEYNTLKIFKSLLKKNYTVLDIGANIGLFSLLASNKIGNDGKIYAFEPIKKTNEVLKENLLLNNINNVIVSCIALSNKVGKVSFSIPNDIDNSREGDAFNSMNLNNDNIDSENQIDCTTLDLFLKENNIINVDLIKIDIEGAEMLCFQGSINLLSSANPPIIIMECAELLCNRFKYSVYDVLAYLNQFGYSFEQYEFNQWIAFPNHVKTLTAKELLAKA
jgi:FkbM family methyltransferase